MTVLVDIEQELITRATARFPDAVVRDELDNKLLSELPTIQITQIPGGGDDGLKLARMIVDIDVYAPTRAEAIALAGEVHRWVTDKLRGSASDAVVIGLAACLSLPASRPYENPDVRRVGGTYEFFCHPVS